MLKLAYSAYAYAFWMIIVGIITYFVMRPLKKSFTSLSCKIQDAQTRTLVNTVVGTAMSMATAYVLGKFGCLMLGVEISAVFFLAGGIGANYVHALVERYADCELLAFANAYKSAIEASNLDIATEDFPKLTARVNEFVAAYETSEKNTHYQAVKGVADALGKAVDIDTEEATVANLKSAGVNTTAVEELIRVAKLDNIITAEEKANIQAAIRVLDKIDAASGC